MKKTAAVLAVLFLFVCLSPISTRSLPTEPATAGQKDALLTPQSKKIDEYLTAITPFGYSGAILVAKYGEILINRGYGLAVREKGIRNTAETIFCIGSITKQFTAAAILKLEMMGKLMVGDTLDKFFSDVPAEKQKITLHQLLTHTSGLIGEVGGDYEAAGRDETVKKILAQPLRSEPGTKFFYSNAGYSLLAAVIEKTGGRTYEDFLSRNLFKPAGMSNTGYTLPRWKNKVVAHWYVGEKDNGIPLDKPFPYWNLIGNGGILSTTEDMFKWSQALKYPKILSSEAKKTLWTPVLNDYACGWDVLETAQGKLFQHDGGSTLGNSADLRVFIEPDIVIVLFSNQSPDGSALILKLRDKIEKLVFGEDVLIPPQVARGDAKGLAKYAGEYRLPLGAKFNVTTGEGGLSIIAEGQGALSLILRTDLTGPKYTELNDRTTALIEKIVRGDYQALFEAFGGGVPLERISARQKRMWEEMENSFGTYKSFRVLGTIPLEGVSATLVQYNFEKGTETIQCVWGPRGLMGIRVPAAPVRLTLLPQTGTEFIGYDIGTARLIKAQFNLDNNGAVTSLVIGGRTATRL